MKNTIKKLVVLSMLSCVGIVAWAENVLYVYTPDPGNIESQGSAYRTKNYAFADKISTSMSVAIWVKDVLQPIHSEEKFIAGVAGCWRLSMLSGVLGFRTGSGSAQTNNYVVNDGNWHFLVGTFNYDSENPANSFQRLYVDGNLAGQLETTISALTTPAKAFSICAPASDMSDAWAKRNFFGYFAELSVWNRALSDSEISTLYARRVGGNESGLVAYWPLTGTPGMATAGYKFPNAAATTGVPNLSNYYLDANQKRALDIVDDDGFTKPYARFVASPEWCTEHSYEQKESAAAAPAAGATRSPISLRRRRGRKSSSASSARRGRIRSNPRSVRSSSISTWAVKTQRRASRAPRRQSLTRRDCAAISSHHRPQLANRISPLKTSPSSTVVRATAVLCILIRR